MQDDEKEIQEVSKAEDVDSTMDEKVEKIPDLINKLNRNMEIQRHFSGPLPLQVLDNLTEEQRDKLLNNFINKDTKEHEANMKTLDMIRENNVENKKIKKILIYTGMPSFLILSAMCIFSGNKDILFEFIKFISVFLGGSGAAALYYENKNRSDKEND